MWKADGIDLVGADACIFAVFFNNVIETSVFFVPEFFSEGSRYMSGKLAVNGGIFFEMFCQFRSHAQRIVPQCIDFYRFSVTRVATQSRPRTIHPGYLVQSASGMDEGVIIHIDGKIRAVCIGMNNFTQNGVNTLLYIVIIRWLSGNLQICVHGIKIPQRGICSVIERVLPSSGNIFGTMP